MLGFELTGDFAALTALLILGLCFVGFLREIYPPEVVAMAGAGIMLALGLLPYRDAIAQLSNPAPWTIAFMFIIMGGLLRTGALDTMSRLVGAHAGSRPRLTVVVMFASVALASAIMNNTPVVAVMIPITIQIARKADIAPSRLLMPLSYMTVMGGMITLLGTSTNLLVDGIVQERDMEAFGILEIAPVGIAITVVGGLFLAVLGPRLIPERSSMTILMSSRKKMKYFTEIAVPEGSSLIGCPVLEVSLFKPDGIRVIDVLRGDASLRRNLEAAVLEPGDRVVLRTEMADLLELQTHKEVRPVDKLSSVQTETVEILISPGARRVGRRLGDLRLRRRYGVYVLAAHRRNQNIGRQLEDLEIRVGDTLLVEGRPEDIQRLAADFDILDVSRPAAKAYRRRYAPVAVAALVLVVVLAALDVAPIVALGFIAATVVLLGKCVDPDEAFGFIEARLLALIFAMLCIGAALEHTGAVAMIVDTIAPILQGRAPLVTLVTVYFLTLVLTELLSNNAVAVVMTPIAISLAQTLGHDPRPFVVAVMFAASVAFATPIGYQTHMMVYGPGGYRFTDFLRVGVPMDIVTGLTACLIIPLLWPL